MVTIAFSWLILRDTINRWQALGILLAFAGILFVVTRGDTSILLALEFGSGDLLMVASITCWALYLVGLRYFSIAVSPWTLLFMLTVSGTAWLALAYAAELAIGLRMDWSWLALASLGYVAVFSTIVAWACVNYGTFKLGPNRASAFMCLHPVFGAILGAIFFSETLSAHHWVGIVLVLIGVVMVSKALSTKKQPAPSPAQG